MLLALDKVALDGDSSWMGDLPPPRITQNTLELPGSMAGYL